MYDAWGNHAVLDLNGKDITSATHIGTLNPFRYRGYYYDTETGLYYLQTRYYDPELCRFLNIDAIEYANYEPLSGHNLYAYCGNNPVMNIDPTGTIFWFFVGLIAFSAVATGTLKALFAADAGANDLQVLSSFLGGLLQGAAMGACLGLGGLAGAGIMGMGMALTGSLLLGAGSELFSYAIESAAYDRSVTIFGILNAIGYGMVQAIGTFAFGYFGGAGGAFGNLAKQGTYAYASAFSKGLVGLKPIFSVFSTTVAWINGSAFLGSILYPHSKFIASKLTTSGFAFLYRLIVKGIFG